MASVSLIPLGICHQGHLEQAHDRLSFDPPPPKLLEEGALPLPCQWMQ